MLVRIVAILAATAALALTATASASGPEGRLLAIAHGDTLVWVDAATLTTLPGPTAALPLNACCGHLSPSGQTYVVGSGNEGALTFFDLQRMQIAAKISTGTTGSAWPIAWPEERRLYVEAWTSRPAQTEILIVDPTARAIVARVPVEGNRLATVATADGIVSLVAAMSSIKPVRVLKIDRDGLSRSVSVGRIQGGTKWRGTGANRRASIRQPAFAVDSVGGVAYVIDPTGLVARADLTTMSVSYHARGARRLARAVKEIDGPMLSARWLGDGRIAISGTKGKLRKKGGVWRQTWAPAGVAVLDTRTWSSRVLDPGAGYFSATRDGVLVTRNGFLSEYTSDGTLRFRVPIQKGDAYASVVGDYAYVWTVDKVTLVNLRDGTVVCTLPNPSLFIVTADT